MKVVSARAEGEPAGLEELPGKANYFIGNDPAKWRTDIPTYAKVKVPGIYPGVDLVWYGNQGQLEYDFVLAPGADPSAIRVAFEGVDRLQVNGDGDLVLTVAGRELVQRHPRVYEEAGGQRHELGAAYVLIGRDLVAYRVEGHDRRRTLVIDPVLLYSTCLGGSSHEEGLSIAVDGSSNVYVTGSTSSANFPTANPIQAATNGGKDAFVAKLNAAGNALVYSTYLGGSSDEKGLGIAVDSSGDAYVTGWTFSTNFPTASPIQSANAGESDAFVAKLNAAGNVLVYSTYLGGSSWDYGNGIAVDGSGNAYVTGEADSTNFPTASPLQPATGAAGTPDAFVAKLNAAGSALVYSTYLGGSSDDRGYGIAVDGSANAYVTGWTYSTNFPTAGPIQSTNGGGNNPDAYVAKLNAAGSALVYSTYLGGSSWDWGYGIAVDGSGNAYVTGYTGSTNFPTAGPVQATNGGGNDAFLAKLNAAGSAFVYSTYLGGSGDDYGNSIAVDGSGNAYVTGYTNSTNFPTASPLQAASGGNGDAFVAKVTTAPLLFSLDVASGPALGGTAVTLTGDDFSPGAAIRFGGIAATAISVSSGTHITATTPAHAAGIVDVVVTNPDGQSGALPGSFTYVPPPNIITISPVAGFISGGTSVTIAGSSFSAGATVSFGGAPATDVAVVNVMTITTTTPAHAEGSVDVVVTNPDGQTGTRMGGFSFSAFPPPTLTKMDPSSGPTPGGTRVTLTGASFLDGATVSLGGVAATDVAVVSPTTINARLPAHAAGVVDVMVTNPDGQTATLAAGYNYLTPVPSSGCSCGATSPPLAALLGLITLAPLARRRSGRKAAR